MNHDLPPGTLRTGNDRSAGASRMMLYNTHASNPPCRMWLEVAKKHPQPTGPGKQSLKDNSDEQSLLDD